jgi:NADPH2:quinone reductase
MPHDAAPDTNVPQEQHAVFITAPGGPDVLQMRRTAVPMPGDDEVLIRVRAAGVNRHDCNQRRPGAPPAPRAKPRHEVAGIIAAAGRAVPGSRIGERVCALTDGGGYSAYAIAKAAQALPVPAGLGWPEAAALPEAAFTIWHNFFRVAQLGPAESVLLHGGASGVGTLAIQILSALGHPVFATCGSPDKVDAARRLGARDAFDYREDDYVAGVHAATGGRGVDVILDMSGARHSVRDVEALARRGRLVHLSPGDNAEFRAPLRTILAKELRVTGSLLRPLPDDEKALIAADLRRAVWPLVESGRVRPVVHAVLPLTAAAEAHRLMEEGRHVGKLVLNVAADAALG